MTWVYDDGGRAETGRRGETGDCVVRAISIASGRPYQDVYEDLHQRAQHWSATVRGRYRGTDPSPRTGMHRAVYEPYLFERGWVWLPTMAIGSGTTVHLRADELPPGRLIVRVSKHVCAVIDGVIRDNHDPARDGTRAVYGYYQHVVTDAGAGP